MIRLTRHAEQQAVGRGIISPRELSQAVNKRAAEIEVPDASPEYEVRVVVKRFDVAVKLPDGSNGDTVLAVIRQDGNDPRVTTVMLQRSSQIERKAAAKEAVYVF